jgi:hypothetical protein
MQLIRYLICFLLCRGGKNERRWAGGRRQERAATLLLLDLLGSGRAAVLLLLDPLGGGALAPGGARWRAAARTSGGRVGGGWAAAGKSGGMPRGGAGQRRSPRAARQRRSPLPWTSEKLEEGQRECRGNGDEEEIRREYGDYRSFSATHMEKDIMKRRENVDEKRENRVNLDRLSIPAIHGSSPCHRSETQPFPKQFVWWTTCPSIYRLP